MCTPCHRTRGHRACNIVAVAPSLRLLNPVCVRDNVSMERMIVGTCIHHLLRPHLQVLVQQHKTTSQDAMQPALMPHAYGGKCGMEQQTRLVGQSSHAIHAHLDGSGNFLSAQGAGRTD